MKLRGPSRMAKAILILYVNHVVPNTMPNSDLSTVTHTIPHLTQRAAQAKMRNLPEVGLEYCHLGRMGRDRPSRLRLGRSGTARQAIVINPANEQVLFTMLKIVLCIYVYLHSWSPGSPAWEIPKWH